MILLYRLLIVDDEPDVLAALVSYFAEEDELDVLAADSARRALAILNAERIDVLLSDINMPGVDGLELLRHVQANWPDCRTIFLTGFTEFDYIYTAKNLGAAGFLLKTEGREKIVATVQAEIQKIKASQAEEAWSARPDQAGRHRPFLLREAVTALLLEEETEQLAGLLKQLCPDISLQEPFFLAVCQIGRQGRPAILAKSDFLLGLEAMAQRYLGRHFAILMGEQSHWQILFLLQPGRARPGQAGAAQLARGGFEKMQDILMDRHAVYASIAIFAQELILSQLAAASQQLSLRLARGLPDGASIHLHKAGQEQAGQPADENQAVAQVRSIIARAYDQDLSLTWLAGQVYLNPSYLSRLFRQQTKMTLVSYINQVRLTKACELLLTSNMKVIDVAAASGFASASYFNQVFRKHTGRSPAEFRQSGAKGQIS